MGQAKLRREALRQKMLREGERWDFPPSPWEAAICAELKNQAVIVVPRAPAEQLAWMRMPAGECHGNARWYAKNDPSGKTKFITGWWVQWPNFVLHSVIEKDGKLICITPTPFNETEIPFIRDQKISWTDDGEFHSAIRDGKAIGVGVRMFPAFTMAQNGAVRERLLTGGNPYSACEFTDAEMEELKRKHVYSDGSATAALDGMK